MFNKSVGYAFFIGACLLIGVLNQLIAQDRTDFLPGFLVFSNTGDTSLFVGRNNSGPFGSIDIILKGFNSDDQTPIYEYSIGTDGVDLINDVLFIGNSIYLTGYSNYSTGNSDEVLISGFNPIDQTGFSKVLSGPFSDKGRVISEFNNGICLLSSTNSSGVNQRMHFSRFNLQGDMLNNAEVDFGGTFFPTDIALRQDTAFISGYSFDNAVLTGHVLCTDTAITQSYWAKSFSGANNIEIQQVLYSGESLFYAGWKEISGARTLIIGALNQAGLPIWSESFVFPGNFSVNSLRNYQGGKLLVSGHLRTFLGNEEEPIIVLLDIATKAIESWMLSDAERSYATDITDSNFNYRTGIFQLDNQNGYLGFWNDVDGGCYSSIIPDSTQVSDNITINNNFVSFHTSNLTISDTSLITTYNSSKYLSACYSTDTQDKNESIGTCSCTYNQSNQKLSFNRVQDCKQLINWIEVYDLNGRLVFEGNRGSSFCLQQGLFIMRGWKSKQKKEPPVIIQKLITRQN